MVVSQFMRDMSVAESVVIEAAIHRDAGHAHRVNTKAAHVTDAEAADMRATNDAHVSTAEATDMTAAKTATARAQGRHHQSSLFQSSRLRRLREFCCKSGFS